MSVCVWVGTDVNDELNGKDTFRNEVGLNCIESTQFSVDITFNSFNRNFLLLFIVQINRYPNEYY